MEETHASELDALRAGLGTTSAEAESLLRTEMAELRASHTDALEAAAEASATELAALSERGEAMKVELSRAIGAKNMRVLEDNIGFSGKRPSGPPEVDPMFRYETAWQQAPRPVYKQATTVTSNDAGARFLSNPCTAKGKFFWPNMTNENIDGKHRKHPMELQMPGAIRDLRSWLQLYGEPDPGKIPTGTMTTFYPS